MESDLSCLGSGQRGLITALRFSGGKRRRLMECWISSMASFGRCI